jgi:hypothetical protein
MDLRPASPSDLSLLRYWDSKSHVETADTEFVEARGTRYRRTGKDERNLPLVLLQDSTTKMPRMVRFYETGGPNVLRVEDAIKHPRNGEVLLKVEAIGLNRADSMFMRGRFFERTVMMTTSFIPTRASAAIPPLLDYSSSGKE